LIAVASYDDVNNTEPEQDEALFSDSLLNFAVNAFEKQVRYLRGENPKRDQDRIVSTTVIGIHDLTAAERNAAGFISESNAVEELSEAGHEIIAMTISENDRGIDIATLTPSGKIAIIENKSTFSARLNPERRVAPLRKTSNGHRQMSKTWLEEKRNGSLSRLEEVGLDVATADDVLRVIRYENFKTGKTTYRLLNKDEKQSKPVNPADL